MVLGCQPYAPAVCTPRKCSWYSFLLEAESTTGPQCDRKDYVNEKSTDNSWDRTSDLPSNIMYQITNRSQRYSVITSYVSGPTSVAQRDGESNGILSRSAVTKSWGIYKKNRLRPPQCFYVTRTLRGSLCPITHIWYGVT